MPISFSEVRSFIWMAQYLTKFIASFLVVVLPLHAITTSGKGFQWAKGSLEGLWKVKNEYQSSSNSGITKIATAL